MTMKAKKVVLVLMVLVLSSAVVFAASAQKLYEDFSDAVARGDLDGAISSYSDLEERINDELSSTNKSLEKAFEKNNMDLYLEARSDLRTLSGYRITREQSDALLALIVEEDGEKALEDAGWLYSISSYYRPTLSLDYSASGENFSYSYRSSVSVKPGTEVTLPDQESINANSNNLGQLVGWGVTRDEVTYGAGDVITMPLTDQTLYAIWRNAVTFKDDVSGIDETSDGVVEGDEIAIPQITSSDGSNVFIGWYDPTTGEFLGPEEEVYSVRGNGASFEALYASLEISNVSTSPYSTLPTNIQVTLTFNVENTGNEDLKDLTVTISSADSDLTILTDTLYFRRLPSGSVGTVSTRIVYTGTESARQIPLTVTVTDEDGNAWSSDFTIASK